MSPLLATALLLAAAPAADQRPVLAVLYFDNDSGDRELDVLQKGLADMLVTDLAGTDKVQVVERQKLQKLIEELDLQKSRYFDPATALKLGRGIGATHAVTGSFHSFEPKLRIDIRLVEIATSKVVLADSVTGTKAQFFELEQQMARRFLSKLDAQLGGAPARTGGADFDAVVAYSKGLDFQDKGELEAASRALADVARRSPQFALATDRQKEVLLVLEALAQRRGDVLFGQSDELLKNADAYLSTHDAAKLKPDAARTYLAYRLIRSRYALFLLEARLGRSTPRAALDGKSEEFKSLMQSYFANEEALGRELKVLGKKADRPVLPPADAARAKTLGLAIDGPLPDVLDALRFVFEGKAQDFAVWPTLAMLDSRACLAAEALADQAALELDAAGQPDRAVDAVDLKAKGLLAVGRTEDATAAWKGALQRWPAGRRYRELETRVKDALGLTATAKQRLEDARWYDRVRKECRQDELERAGPHFGKQRAAAEGLHGWRRTVADLSQACGSNPGLGKLYAGAATAASAAGDCGFYDKLTLAMERVDRAAAWALKGEVHCDPEGQDAPSAGR